MRSTIVWLIARQFWKNVFQTKSIYFLITVFVLLLLYASYSGYKNYTVQNSIRTTYQQMARQSWVNNPDKHPHRMAHFGSFAFRLKHQLSMFDNGMESFTGNAIFLEAHKQNTVNFSEAGFSTGLLRFGEISIAMLLQVILPLLIFFLGFSAIAAAKENGTLKIILGQGASWKEMITGNAVGLMGIALLFFATTLLSTTLLLLFAGNNEAGSQAWMRFTGITITYLIFYWVICVITILVSAISKTAKEALLKLLGIWLLFAVLLPKTMQSVGSAVFPSPSKFELETAVEKDVIKEGDSHNPDDPHFKAIKDSLLRRYNIDSVQQLPFNYNGYLNQVGEQMSSAIYNRHLQALNKTFKKQNGFSAIAGFINPVNAVRDISMAFAGTDFAAYTHFQQQAETYRYQLAQQMNGLQTKYISNKPQADTDKPYTVSSKHWEAFPDFEYRHLPITAVMQTILISLSALALWLSMSLLLITLVSKKAKVI